MAGIWLDSVFSPVRQEILATLGTAYSNATADYTTILTQQVTAGRFSQPGATTTLMLEAVVSFESDAGGVFTLACNGSSVEVASKPGGGGGSTSGWIQRAAPADALAADTGQWTIGRVNENADIVQAWILAEGSGVAEDAANVADWTFYTFNETGGLVSVWANVASTPTGTGTIPAFGSVTIAPSSPTTITAGHSCVVEVQKAGTGVQLPIVIYGVDYTTAGGGGGGSGIASVTLKLSVTVPVGTYTVTLTGAALGGGTVTIDPAAGDPGSATIEVTEYATG